ncbi:MAG: 50S ribosomal protein L6 [Deltaproteobacteria bacterium]|nr:50S ribosomal protein L6 [Deltaproteobacteria bacterium]MBI4374190.1 50S ribosomal protein L6 [Deltaproteobacteria bacterium]
MSRIGKQPIKVPEKVKVTLQNDRVLVEGPLGKLEQVIDPMTSVLLKEGVLTVSPKGELSEAGMRHGLMRNLICNMVEGVTHGFKKDLEINGVGYRAEVKGNSLNMTLGFSHPIEFPVPQGIKIQVEKQVRLQVSGISKALVGETAARIRKLRLPEPYKGKGIKYLEEVIHRKVGKAAAGAGGAK